MPKTREDFWEPKFRANVERDARVQSMLTADGWRIVVVWECETTDDGALLRLARLVERTRVDDARASLGRSRKRARR
jgi:DNA mismatch endonuclease (patch repair protein)